MVVVAAVPPEVDGWLSEVSISKNSGGGVPLPDLMLNLMPV